MKYKNLGKSDLNVSKICLGTMTFGEQNTQKEAFEQLDFALDQGVNFIDTAESYPVPFNAETYTKTEEYIGNWLSQKNNRSKVILATKIAGSGAKQWIGHIRGGKTRFDKETISQTLNSSLKRLKTDYVDLYQLHWPNRTINIFGMLAYPYDTVDTDEVKKDSELIVEAVEAMSDLIESGKIRHYGLSNETPWGMMKFVQIAEKIGAHRPISIQNIYNLINRTYEMSHAEITQRENIDLLAYSPLAFSVLSGKYITGLIEDNARLKIFRDYFERFDAFKTNEIVNQYLNLAKESEISLAKLAISYLDTKGFIGSTIIGATNLTQLKENIESIDVDLSPEVLDAIEAIHQSKPNPCL